MMRLLIALFVAALPVAVARSAPSDDVAGMPARLFTASIEVSVAAGAGVSASWTAP